MSSSKPYACPYCEFRAVQSRDRDSHCRRKHPEQAVPTTDHFPCAQCAFTATSGREAYLHRAMHRRQAEASTQETLLFCTECSYNTATKRYLNRHILSHNATFVHRCTACAYSTYRRDVLVRHEKTHARDELRSFECCHCLSMHISPYALRRHIERAHGILPERRRKK